MKMSINKNEIRRKLRRIWKIKPFTKIMGDKNKYHRSTEKKLTREILSELENQENKTDDEKN